MAQDQIARFGVSLSRALLKQLDRMVQKKGYRNRSLAISDMIRDTGDLVRGLLPKWVS